MRGSICRRLQHYATTSVIGLTSLAVICVSASNLLVPTVSLPKQTASEVVLTAAIINNSNSTIGVADSDIWGHFLPDGSPDTVAIDRHLDALESLGVDTIRVLIPWHGVQPLPPEELAELPKEFQDAIWAQTDYIINAAADRDMAILGVLNSTPGWAVAQGSGGWGLGAEPDPVKYAAYAEAVANRYTGLVSAYEIWNEPNAIPYWTPAPDPAAYTEVLKAAYTAINRADPNALVVAGVLGAITDYVVGDQVIAMDARTFVAEMYANDAEGYFDALSFHPYQYTTKFSEGEETEETPWNADSPLEMMIAIRQLMIENDDAELRIWATEYGLPTGGPEAVTPHHQADYIADFLATWDDFSYTGPAFIYTTVDRGDGTEAGSFGIFYANWDEKPAADVIRDAIAGENYEEFIEEAVEDLQVQLADAVAQAYADALAKALADAWAAALAAAFGVVTTPAATALAVTDETEVTATEVIETAQVPEQADVTAQVTVTSRVQTSTQAVRSEQPSAEEATDETGALDVRPGELQPVVEQPARQLAGGRKPSNGGAQSGDDADADSGARGTTSNRGQSSRSVTNGTSTNDLKANDDTESGESGAAGATPSEAAS
jgi:hypothetical protein